MAVAGRPDVLDLGPISDRSHTTAFRVPVPTVPEQFTESAHFKVYVIRCGAFAKIGTTRDVAQRVRTILSATPFELELVGVFFGGHAVEKLLHTRFKELRHRDEWFRVEGPLEEWISAGCDPTSHLVVGGRDRD